MTNWPRLALQFLLVYGVIFGAHTTARYDARSERIVQRRSKWLRYGRYVFFTILFGVMMPLTLLESRMRIQVYETNPLARYTNAFNKFYGITNVLLTLVLQWWYEPRLLAIVQQLSQLQQQLKQQQYTRDYANFRDYRLLGVGIAILWYQHCAILLSVLDENVRHLWRHVVSTYFFCVLVSTPHLVLFYHGAILCYIRTACNELHNQMEHTFIRTCHKSLFAACEVHATLVHTIKDLNNVQRVQVFCVMANFVVSLILYGYLTIVLLHGYMDDVRLSGIAVYVMLLIAMYNYSHICELTMSSLHSTTVAILAKFIELPEDHNTASTYLKRAFEVFALHLTHKRHVSINLWDIFSLNHSAIFRMFTQIILFTIVLIQNDYNNIGGQHNHSAKTM